MTYADLDVDDTDWEGPETTTILQTDGRNFIVSIFMILQISLMKKAPTCLTSLVQLSQFTEEVPF